MAQGRDLMPEYQVGEQIISCVYLSLNTYKASISSTGLYYLSGDYPETVEYTIRKNLGFEREKPEID